MKAYGDIPAELPVIPLWIDGHAYLTITPKFATVRRVADGAPLRRVPVCGAAEADLALRSARAAQTAWSAQPIEQRRRCLIEVGDAVSGYAGHFAALIGEETGKKQTEAEAEVSEAIRCLNEHGVMENDETRRGERGVRVVFGDVLRPLTGILRLAVPAWLAGATVVARSPAEAPSALFALAELTARRGWPGGVFSLLHGDASTDEALRATDRSLFP